MDLVRRTNSSHELLDLPLTADRARGLGGMLPVTATPAVLVGAEVAALGIGAFAAGATIGDAID